MSKSKSSKLTVLFTLVCCITLLFTVTVFTAPQSVSADAAEPTDLLQPLKVMNLSDVHLFPVSNCYPNATPTSDFGRATLGDSKLLVESAAILRAALDECKQAKPDLLIINGDLSSNSERQALIDLANALRELQNYMRANGKPNFQVFLTPGNHDISNHRATDYSVDGSAQSCPYVDRVDFVKIFAGIGYPSMSVTEAQGYYTAAEWEVTATEATVLCYTPTTSGVSYVYSDLNTWSFDYDYITDYTDMTIYYEDLDYEDLQMGGLSYLATGKDDTNFEDYAVYSIDVVLSNPVDEHVTGGKMQDIVYEWIDAVDPGDGYTKLATMHHNLLNHFDYEENYVTAFVLYDWERTAEFFADKGIRYVYSGHMHASDTAKYVSFNNNVVYDYQTGSTISYGAAYRFIDISRYTDAEGKLYEKNYTQIFSVDSADFTALFDQGYLNKSTFTSNPLYAGCFDANSGICKDLFTYCYEKTAAVMLDSIIDGYVNPNLINTLSDMATGAIGGLGDLSTSNSFLNTLLGAITPYIDVLESDLPIIINNLFEQANVKLLADYTYKGSNPLYTGGEHKFFAYLNELVLGVLSEPIAYDDKTPKTIEDLVIYAYTQYLSGGGATQLSDCPEWIQSAVADLYNGKIFGMIVDALLNEDTGLYPILVGLIETKLDLTAGLSQATISKLNPILGIVGTSLEEFCLNDIANMVLPMEFVKDIIDLEGKSVVEFLDETIEKYYTESFKTGLGGIIGDVLTSFLVDTTPDGDIINSSYDSTKSPTENKMILTIYNPNDEYSYLGRPYTDTEVPPTIENGKLPSMLTVTFGNDTKTQKNFVYFTAPQVEDTVIQYMKGTDVASFKAESATVANGAFEKIYYPFAVFNLGLFSTTTDKVIGRHAISLSSLEAGTSYLYRIGDGDGYWSDVYTFSTAPEAGTAFDVLLISDMQSMLTNDYNQVNYVLGKAGSAFDEGYDFIINCGDHVDYGKNMQQWQMALNIPAAIWRNSTQVNITGNHEESQYEVDVEDEDFRAISGVSTKAYNPLTIHFDNPNVPEQSATAGSGCYYSFDYSDVHFTVLNTNDIGEDNNLGAAQYAWLVNDLQTTTKKHKVVCMHKSLYSIGSHTTDKEVMAMRDTLSTLFYNEGVEIVLAGHDHTYSESFFLDANGKVKDELDDHPINLSDSDGVLYVTLGTVGNKYYNAVETDLPIAYGEELHNPTLRGSIFAKLSYDGESLYYRGYQYTASSDQVVALPYNNTIWIILTTIIAAGGIALVIIMLVKEVKLRKNPAYVEVNLGETSPKSTTDNAVADSTAVSEDAAATESVSAEETVTDSDSIAEDTAEAAATEDTAEVATEAESVEEAAPEAPSTDTAEE